MLTMTEFAVDCMLAEQGRYPAEFASCCCNRGVATSPQYIHYPCVTYNSMVPNTATVYKRELSPRFKLLWRCTNGYTYSLVHHSAIGWPMLVASLGGKQHHQEHLIRLSQEDCMDTRVHSLVVSLQLPWPKPCHTRLDCK